MQENHLFEYAVIRIVPRVEREEFLNAGVILYCKTLKFLRAKVHLSEQRLLSLAGSIDMDEVRQSLYAFERISEGNESGGPIGKLDPASRFRWLTATRSTVVQTSKVHPGLCHNPDETLERLFTEQVSMGAERL